jgi:hypothetical protein
VLPWDAESAEQFLNLRRKGVRIGTMDLKIAASHSRTTPRS